MTAKQQLLLDCYSEHWNVALAAKQSGYKSRQSAHYFLTKHDIAKKQISYSKETYVSEIVERKREIFSKAKSLTERSILTGDDRTALRAMEFEARLLNMFNESPEANLDEQKQTEDEMEYSKLSIEELETLKALLLKCKKEK